MAAYLAKVSLEKGALHHRPQVPSIPDQKKNPTHSWHSPTGGGGGQFSRTHPPTPTGGGQPQPLGFGHGPPPHHQLLAKGPPKGGGGGRWGGPGGAIGLVLGCKADKNVLRVPLAPMDS